MPSLHSEFRRFRKDTNMKCEFCKSEITDINAKFCPVCGGKIERQVIPENVTSVSRANELLVSKIQEYFSTQGVIKNIFVGKNIPQDALSHYKELSKDEEPLVLVNAESPFFSGYTGILITKTRVHYIAQKKGFGGTFLGSGEELSGSVSLKNHHFFIGEEASSYDGSYFGDEFYIDGKLRGWIRFDKSPWLNILSPSRKGVTAMRELFLMINTING